MATNVSRACTLDLAPVRVRDTFGVLLNRGSLEVPFAKHQGRLASELRADHCSVAWSETQPWSRAQSATGSEPSSTLSTVSKRRDAHEALELGSMVLSADHGAAQSVPEGMEIVAGLASNETTPISDWILRD